MLPGLRLSARPSRISRSRTTNVTFTVTDPDRVGGAKVNVLGKTAITRANGKAVIALGPTRRRRFTAVASKAGYTSMGVVIKTRR